MKKLIAIPVILCVCLMPVSSQVHIKNGNNIFKECFKEIVETIIFVLWDGTVWGITTYNEGSVEVSYEVTRELLKNAGVEISDIAIVIHNHFARPTFSPRDLRTLECLKRDGFNGSFCLYIQSSGKVKYIRDKNTAIKQFINKKETKKFLKKYKKKYPEAYKEILTFIKKEN